MKPTVLIAVTLMMVAACGSSESTETTAPSDSVAASFPVTVAADNGEVTIPEKPEAIVSLSAVATEMLFAIGAGAQVIAVDDQSNYPPEAPTTDLSGFTPNLEALLALEPDLVVITFDPGDLIAGLDAVGVPVLAYTAANTVDDVYRQIEALGAATGNGALATQVNEAIGEGLAEAVASADGSGEGVTYYHEIDSGLYTATSATFFGEIYGLFGMVNIADPADADGSAFGYPQLSSEFIVTEDPDIVFLSNTAYGESAETASARPGWDVMSAVRSGRIVELDSDVASRWGPRIVEFAQAIAGALMEYHSG